MEGEEVWVAEIWSAHGEDQYVLGVYDSREAAFEALKDQPNMTVYVQGGIVYARPVRERQFTGDWRSWGYGPPVKWGRACPKRVQGRKLVSAPVPGAAAPIP